MPAGAVFVSCDDDNDDLKSQIAVLQTAVEDLKEQLGNALTTGASITNAEQDESGQWTLTLSDGKKIVIGSSLTGGGAAVSVVVTDTEAIITVNGVEYKIPLGSSVSSLMYSPETVDGIVQLGNDGVDVKFLPRPEMSSIDGAEFSIAESHKLTRAKDGEQFKVTGEATLEDGFIKVHIIGLEIEAGGDYAVSLQMNYRGSVIGSNFFNIHVSDDFSFKAEDLVTPTFSSAVTDAVDLGDGFWQATLPESADFLGTFNFKDLVTLDGIDNVVYVLGKQEYQNSSVSGRYDFLSDCLAEDGTWTMTERPGTNCAASENDENPDGMLVYLKSNEVIKAKIYWKIVDPLAGADFRGALTGLCGAHLEYGDPSISAPIILEAGANKVNLAEILLGGKFSTMHDQGALVAALQGYSAEWDGETVIYASGTSFVVNEDFKNKYAKHSAGLNWYNMQTSIAASQRQNWTTYGEFTDEDKQKYNGEIISGYDGLPGEEMTARGLSVTSDGFFETTSAYEGWALRVGMGLEFQYDYGTIPVSDGVLAFIWFNRRQCPEGVVDPAAR